MLNAVASSITPSLQNTPPPNPLHTYKEKTSQALREIEKNSAEVHEALQAGIDAALRRLQHEADIFNRKLAFSVHKDLNRIVIRIIDTETNTVIRQVPPDEILHLMEEIRKTAGLFLDKRT